MMKLNRKFYKKLTTSILVILTLALGVIFGITAHYKHIIRKKLPEWVAASTDSVYKVSYEDVSLNVFTHSITISGLKLQYDTAQIKRLHTRHEAFKNYFSLYIPELELEKISWSKSIENKELTCDGIYIYRPRITIFHMPWLSDWLRKTKHEQSKLKRLYAGIVKVKHAHAIYKDLEVNDNSTFTTDDGNFVLEKWEYIPGQARKENSFAFAESGTIYLRNISYLKPQRLYKVSANSLYFSSNRDSMKISELKLTPNVDTATFYARIGHQSDMFSAFFPSVIFTDLSWKKFITQWALVSKKVLINNAVISDYFSRFPPRNVESKYGKFPHQLLQKMELPVYIENAVVRNSTIKYTELNSTTKIPATLSFDNLQGNLRNITNIPEYLSKNKNCTIDLQGKFMGQFDMAAAINLLLTDRAGAFTASSYMLGLRAPGITKQVQALSLVNIKTLNASKMEFTMKGNENYASAKLTMRYNDLKIKLQELSKDSTRLKNKAITSFFANYTMLLQANPMPGEGLRSVSTYVKRSPDQSFFNLIWKNILQGIFKTIAKSSETAALMEEKANSAMKQQAPQEKRKKGFLKMLFGKKNKDRQ